MACVREREREKNKNSYWGCILHVSIGEKENEKEGEEEKRQQQQKTSSYKKGERELRRGLKGEKWMEGVREKVRREK